MSRYLEIVSMIDNIRSENDVELIYTLTDDAIYTGSLTDTQCCRIYDLIEKKFWN